MTKIILLFIFIPWITKGMYYQHANPYMRSLQYDSVCRAEYNDAYEFYRRVFPIPAPRIVVEMPKPKEKVRDN